MAALTDAQILEIRIASAKNADHAALARHYKRTVRYINQIVSGEVRTDLPLVEGRSIGVTIRRRRLEALRPQIDALAEEGLNTSQIAKKLGCSRSSVMRHLRGHR